MTDTNRPTNRLAGETSPYLLQHAHNPVDWYPWGPEALARSRAEGKPIFLSIGYSACHWCHVMERESFEDDAIAALMNEHYVNVKVDREERPDLDEIYMKAVMRLTGSGGWPMSVFLTPDLLPFYGGTYFPPRGAYGRPGFADVLWSLAKAWERDRDGVTSQGERLAREIAAEGRVDARGALDPTVLDRSLEALAQNYDAEWGGFGSAPKFPHAMDLRLCLRHHERTGDAAPRRMALDTLDRMAEGGIHDQLGGGFHRYSTDEKWLIPHFEKMLYDNALLVPAYLEAWQLSGEERYADVARGACEWMLREMVAEGGAFASTQDADTEGEEGKFFVWTPRELEALLGRDLGRQAAAWWGVTDAGNFEHGTSALWRPEPAGEVAARLRLDVAELEQRMREARERLFAARAERTAPARDDKVLTAWNGLAIGALARAYQALEEPRFLDAATRAARYLLAHHRRDDGTLFATGRDGRARHEGCLDDYVFLIAGLLDLYESDFDTTWLEAALELADVVERDFHDADHDGYFTTGARHEELIARLKNPHDGALPSGNGVHAENLLRLAELTGRGDLGERAERTLRSLAKLVGRYPAAFSQLLMAVHWLAVGPREVVVSGAPEDARTRALLRAVRTCFAPAKVVALAAPGADATELPLLEGRIGSEPRAWICRHYTCHEPLTDPAAVARALAD
ncbi:MAG: thioredoxin domain-containing protein [Planctomycetes bacterium]|nr:thioredoxin domain-containing protein [Planctomycetota bacterium]